MNGGEKWPYWSVAELEAAIDRCEKECAEMALRHAPVDEIDARREGLDVLRKILETARKELGA